jgi:mono/diheme cytochrome c family protein
MRMTLAMCGMAVWLGVLSLGAQEPPPVPPAKPTAAPPPAAAPAAGVRQTERQEEPQFDPAAVQRGHELLVARCGFCHGSNARGAATGPDLTRSALVQEDENGKQLGAFLRVGRPEKNMPKFELTEQEVSDLAAFLHATISQVANRGEYKILDIVTGDPKAGAAFFNGAGGCRSCHSAEGDLRGIGAKYDPVTLQGRVLMPRGSGRRRRGAGQGRFDALADPNAVKATVSLPSGESFAGALVRLTDFDVTIYDLETGDLRSWLRADGVPKVEMTDPLQAHVDLLRRWTDTDMHDVTAYLAGLK